MDDLLAFSIEQVSRVTELSVRQLAYWDRTGFFQPEFAAENRRTPFSRVYSFRDVVGLKTISTLRRVHRVALQELRNVAKWLTSHGTEVWATQTFYVLGRHVFFEDPTSGQFMSGHGPGQSAMKLPMIRVVREARMEVEKLRQRTADEIGRVERHRNIVHNVPTLAGTRIPTSAVKHLHEAGYSTEAIIREYPRLTPRDVEAALAFEETQRSARAG
jgi:uncharacterized protein (DUF433 family)